jgi:cyanophycinase-like exopeptidase
MKTVLLFFLYSASFSSFSQNYTSYLSGSSTDAEVSALGGICLMGGASEHDEAMKWFLQQSNGGDILVLRATGSNGYNNYMYSQLGVSVNSVETIVCHNAQAAYESYVQDRIKKAEAIWFAGGDQWTYITYWRNTPVDSLINKGLAERNLVIGGTSAGMAIQGAYYFSAQNGTVTSPTALSNPFVNSVTVSNEPFIINPQLANVITDTHYDNPDRKGRHVVFLSRILNDFGVQGKGIACDEYTAVCIPPNGICRIYGEYPLYDENVYFIQPNCDLAEISPETLLANTPLTWNRNGQALQVYHAKGTMTGSQTFDLNTWNSGDGGVWENWSVVNGTLNVTAGTAPVCSQASLDVPAQLSLQIAPNPVNENFQIISETTILAAELFTLDGKQVELLRTSQTEFCFVGLPTGTYLLKVFSDGSEKSVRLHVFRN